MNNDESLQLENLCLFECKINTFLTGLKMKQLFFCINNKVCSLLRTGVKLV